MSCVSVSSTSFACSEAATRLRASALTLLLSSLAEVDADVDVGGEEEEEDDDDGEERVDEVVADDDTEAV